MVGYRQCIQEGPASAKSTNLPQWIRSLRSELDRIDEGHRAAPNQRLIYIAQPPDLGWPDRFSYLQPFVSGMIFVKPSPGSAQPITANAKVPKWGFIGCRGCLQR